MWCEIQLLFLFTFCRNLLKSIKQGKKGNKKDVFKNVYLKKAVEHLEEIKVEIAKRKDEAAIYIDV